MARTKQSRTTSRPINRDTPRMTSARMTASTVRPWHTSDSHKKPKQHEPSVFLSADVRALKEDGELHPYSGPTHRQPPAMTRYCGAPSRAGAQTPKEKRRYPRSQTKRKGATLTKSPAPSTKSPAPPTKSPAPPTNSPAPPTNTPAPPTNTLAPPSRPRGSEVTPLTQPEVIDLTEDD